MLQMCYRAYYANVVPDKQKMLIEMIERQIIRKPIHVQSLQIQVHDQPTSTVWWFCGQLPKPFHLIQGN